LKVKRFVGIILVNAENKVLLQLRSKDNHLYPDCWTLPGGKVEEGESLEQAIVREVREELGWDLRGYGLFRTIVLSGADGTTERHIYWGKISERAEDLKLGEGAALKCFFSEEVLELEVVFDLKPVIIDFLKTKPQGQKL
jgi:mutator protein MutT